MRGCLTCWRLVDACEALDVRLSIKETAHPHSSRIALSFFFFFFSVTPRRFGFICAGLCGRSVAGQEKNAQLHWSGCPPHTGSGQKATVGLDLSPKGRNTANGATIVTHVTRSVKRGLVRSSHWKQHGRSASQGQVRSTGKQWKTNNHIEIM